MADGVFKITKQHDRFESTFLHPYVFTREVSQFTVSPSNHVSSVGRTVHISA